LDVDCEAKSALERQKPTIHYWGSTISICIWTLLWSLWMYWTSRFFVGLFVWMYHNKQWVWTKVVKLLLASGYFFSKVRRLRKLTECRCLSMVLEWKRIWIGNELLFLGEGWYPWFDRT
jgi:hypothetical protein